MQPNNLTALDFEDIKASIKSYLRTRDEFTDYDFDGSALSYLIDMLSYNTYYTAFNANMAINEAFLPSATIRDNIVKIAKLLNYVPSSVKASRACLKFDLQTELNNGFYPSSVTLKKGAIATGGNYIWNIINDITVEVNPANGLATFDNVEVYEGTMVDFSYVVNTFAKQRYIIPAENADMDTLTVRVRANETATASDLYSRVDNITTIGSTTRSYFLSETDDMRYEVKFGDDTIGRSVKDGEVITFSYVVTSGEEANGIQRFSFVSTVIDSNGRTYTPVNVTITVKSKSVLGAAEESVESIKYNAPRYYSAQYRAVTAQDYEVITKKLYDNADAVVAYGGDSLNPPVYGKVYIAIKTKTGSDLNDQTKKNIVGLLKDYAMAAITPVIVDPDNVYVNPKIFVTYDTGCGSNTTEIKSDISTAIVDWAGQTQINNFNSTFSSQSLQRSIVLSNNCVADVTMQITLLKYIEPVTYQTNTYCITIGNTIYNSAPSQDVDLDITIGDGDGDGTDGTGGDGTDGTGGDDGGTGQESNQCKKEPVIQSGTFRTADRPGVDQQFEDDGYGNLRTFYISGTGGTGGSRKIYTDDAAGTVNYSTGEICFGPINIIGTGENVPSDADILITDPTTGSGSVVNPGNLPGIDTDGGGGDGGGGEPLLLPVITIPSNQNVIVSPTPGTVINIITPEISVVPIGTPLPPTIPLNSLTPTVYSVNPETIDVPSISNPGSLNTSSCFS